MKNAGIIWMLCALLLPLNAAFSASREERIATRIDTATLALKGHALVITAIGMGRTPTAMGRGGRILPRGPSGALNKDGFLEYNLVFYTVPGYTGFKMQPIKASYKERSVPQGAKGVRLFAEFNQKEVLLAETKKPKWSLPFTGKKKQEKNDETTGAITGGTPKP
jgi:hypothetical protein